MTSVRENQKVILLDSVDPDLFPEDFQARYHTHIYCLRGKANFRFNAREYQCRTGEFIFFLVDSQVSELWFSNNFKGLALFVDRNFLIDNFPSQRRSVDALLYSKENPVLHPENRGDKEKILNNFRALHDRSQERSHRFYDEILKLQMQMYLLEMWHIFSHQQEQRERSLQSGTLYDRFIHLVQERCIREREVRFYSEQLNISPKYLNHICKANTGVSASQWIQRYTRERIIVLLKDKNLNISEISDEMGFSSRSFFTRYVKKLLGESPSAYRQRF